MGVAKEDKDVRVVFVEFPILSEELRVASQAAIAATKQNKYFEFHSALMEHNGPVKEDIIFKAAADVGLDVEKLKADMKAPEVNELIEKNLQLGTAMGVQGTPAIFVGDEAIPRRARGSGQDFENRNRRHPREGMQHLLTIARAALFGNSPSAFLIGPLSGGLIV